MSAPRLVTLFPRLDISLPLWAPEGECTLLDRLCPRVSPLLPAPIVIPRSRALLGRFHSMRLRHALSLSMARIWVNVSDGVRQGAIHDREGVVLDLGMVDTRAVMFVARCGTYGDVLACPSVVSGS